MMSYTLYDSDGETPIHVFHTDRELCDDQGCVCTLPSTGQKRAQDRAADRDLCMVTLGIAVIAGPVSSAEARKEIDRLVAKGCKPRLLKLTEDYT